LTDYKDVFYTFPLRTPKRDELRDFLLERGIETRIQHPLALTHQPAFQGKFRGAAPRAMELVQEILCIPAHEKMAAEQQAYVIDCIREFFSAAISP